MMRADPPSAETTNHRHGNDLAQAFCVCQLGRLHGFAGYYFHGLADAQGEHTQCVGGV